MASDIAFSEEQQAAVLGHVLRHPDLWRVLDTYGVTKEWFEKSAHSTAFDHLKKFRERFKRPPTTPREFLANLQEDKSNVQWIKETLGACNQEAKHQPWELIASKLQGWAKYRVLVNQTHALVEKANAGKHDEAFSIAEAQVRSLQAIDRITGDVDDFEAATDQFEKVLAGLDDDVPEPIQYPIAFLQDLTGGLGKHDLHVVTAYTGIGKTELAKMVGVHNAGRDKKVAAFFLEAAPQEIERRHTYTYLYDWIKKDHPTLADGTFNYPDYEKGVLNKLVKPYSARLRQQLRDDKLYNLKTYYRKAKEFTVHTLEAKILEAAEWADLIILDHIHYIDTPGQNENREMHDIIKKCRDLSIHLGTPMLVIAHLRKHQAGGRKEKALLPDTDEIQGAGAIGKMATAIIALGRPPEGTVVSTDSSGGQATMVKATKYRPDGPRTRYTAIAFFGENTRVYEPGYALGHLAKGGSEWAKADKRPYWAKHATVKDITFGEVAQDDDTQLDLQKAGQSATPDA